MKQIRICSMVLFVFMLTVMCGTVSRAAGNVTITKCQINSNRKKVVVKAVVTSKLNSSDGKYYLFALQPYEKHITASMKPTVELKQKASLMFSVDLNRGTRNDKLYKRFVVAVKKGGGYKIVSNGMYITNPEKLAKYKYSFPRAKSKKGLQPEDSMSLTKMAADTKELGISHAVVNIVLNNLILSKSKQNESYGIAYQHNGKTYYFSREICSYLDNKISALTKQGVIVNAVLLLRNTKNAEEFITPAARKSKTASYVGLNVKNKSGVDNISAIMSFLGERYMSSNKKQGRVVNWILGNEIDNYKEDNYMGELSLGEYAEAYADSFRVVSTALRSIYSKARVYTSLTHCWNIKQPWGSFTSKQTLDAFAKAIKKNGSIPWNLAYHPYPQPLTDAKFWDDLTSESESSTFITMKNIHVLTKYVTANYGKDVHIILSEQGFSSSSGQKMQAAAMVYAYYIAEANSRIDAFILHRHQDHLEETAQGLYLGLKKVSGKKKKAWNVFKYMDTAKARSKTKALAKTVGLSSFESGIDGFSYSKFGEQKNSSSVTGSINLKSGWTSLNSRKVVAEAGKITAYVDSKKKKSYQGITKTLEKKTSFKSKNRLRFKIKISGMSGKKANIKVQFYSGKRHYDKVVSVLIGKSKTITVSLADWKYRGSVTKIRITAKPSGKGKWKNEGKVVISSLKNY